MKKIVIPCIAVIFILSSVLSIAGCQQTETQTYNNYLFGFSCEYPDGWALEETIPGVVVAFVEPSPVRMGRTVNIVITAEVSYEFSGLTVEEYARNADEQLSLGLDSYESLDEYSTDNDGIPVLVRTYSFDMNDTIMKGTQAYIINNNTLYIIGYVAAPDHYADYLGHFNLVIESFRF